MPRIDKGIGGIRVLPSIEKWGASPVSWGIGKISMVLATRPISRTDRRICKEIVFAAKADVELAPDAGQGVC